MRAIFDLVHAAEVGVHYSVPGVVLRHAREQANIRQSAMAKILNTNGTFVSRLETGGPVDAAFAERYLEGLGTELASNIRQYYCRSWMNLEPPSFLHPNREHIWSIEETFQRLSGFEQTPHNHVILSATIAAIREDLNIVFRYLERLDHIIAWVGDIGVGKTTALAHAAGLLVPDGKGQLRSIFPVGSGRTTVCETLIKTAPAFGVAVEPLGHDAIRALVRDLVAGISGQKSSVPSEIARVLRNMSGYISSRTLAGDEYVTLDPILEMIKSGEGEEIIVDKVVAAMKLVARRETSLAISENTEDGMNWLARTISRINIGLDQRFSVPKRITVLVPTDNLPGAGEISIVDTKGVETITQRPDLRGYIDDPRTLVVLCTKFPDAPNATVQRILRENEDIGSDAANGNRISMLVLPRNDEPLQVLDQGEPPASRAEGCAIRREEITQALSGAGLPKVMVKFYDAHSDKPESIWAALRSQIDAMRGKYAERLSRSVTAVSELITNVDLVKTRGARKKIEEDFDLLCTRIMHLPSPRRLAHENLIEQFDIGHQSSVAASMLRRGNWPNFPILHMLGVGVRQDANLRSVDHFSRIQHTLEDNRHRFSDIADVRAMIGSLQDRVTMWRQDFLAQSLSIGSDAFAPVIENETELWAALRGRYGTGVPGYKRDLAAIWKEFFESAAPDDAKGAVEMRLADAWVSTIIEPLTLATKATNVDVIS